MNINDLISANPVGRSEQENRRRKVLSRFSAWLPERRPEPWDLLLYPFTAIRPLKYMNLSNVAELGIFFEKNRDLTLNALTRFEGDFSHAIAAVLQPSSSWGHEHPVTVGANKRATKSDGYLGIDQVWHPEYQRYAEHAFNHLINIPLAVLEAHKGSQYCNQTLANRVEELSRSGLSFVCDGYDAIVRNAISHGRFRFTLSGIEYINVRQNGDRETVELTSRELMQRFDRQVAACNELITALVLFMLHYWSDIEKRGLQTLPAGLLQLALTGAGTHRHLQITRLIESDIGPNTKQLIIACTTNVISRDWHRMAAFHLVALAQSLSADKYARFGIELDCGRASAAVIYLDGVRLLEARQKNEGGEALGEIIESQLLWYDAPKWSKQLITRWTLFRALSINTYEKHFEDLGQKGVVTQRRFYDLKDIAVVGAQNGVGIAIKVVLRDDVSRDGPTLKTIAQQIISQQRLHPRRRNETGGRKGWPQTPSYIRLHIYPQDDVLRNLEGRLKDGALIEVEWEKKHGRYIYVRHPHEIIGNLRIRYANEVLLNSTLTQTLDDIFKQAAGATLYNLDEVQAQAEQTLAEIVSTVQGEAPGLQKLWLFKEMTRYLTWTNTLDPAHRATLQIVNKKLGNPVPDFLGDLVKPEEVPRREEEMDLNNLLTLSKALYAFFLQRFLFTTVGPLIAEDKVALRDFNTAYHRVLQNCVDDSPSVGGWAFGISEIKHTLEDALDALPDLEQIAFYKKELGVAIGRCSRLMPRYREKIYNGADELIQMDVDDARRCLRVKSPDLEEMRVIYQSLVDTPYTMLSVLRRDDPDIQLT